jgi:hypothetical protein
MELTPRQFAELVQQLKGSSRFGGPGDQRRAPRVEQQSRVTIAPIADGRPQADELVLVKNVSSRGLGFVRARKLKTGSQFIVRLPGQSGGAGGELLCTVARCETVQKGLYSIGAEFVSVAAIGAASADRIADSKVA